MAPAAHRGKWPLHDPVHFRQVEFGTMPGAAGNPGGLAKDQQVAEIDRLAQR